MHGVINNDYSFIVVFARLFIQCVPVLRNVSLQICRLSMTQGCQVLAQSGLELPQIKQIRAVLGYKMLFFSENDIKMSRIFSIFNLW